VSPTLSYFHSVDSFFFFYFVVVDFLFSSGSKSKTFKPLKAQSGQTRNKLSDYAKATLGSGNMRAAVVLPKGEDLNEWLAVNSKKIEIDKQHRDITHTYIDRQTYIHICVYVPIRLFSLFPPLFHYCYCFFCFVCFVAVAVSVSFD
jgi:hypothetical protein